ncbi:MAG: adenylate kinase family protein [Acidimicrobiales bacterium]
MRQDPSPSAPASSSSSPSRRNVAPLGLLILGRQGSGKGTQAERIAAAYGVVHISTGDMLRAAVADHTELGDQADEIMKSGGLVPDDVMNGIVEDRLAKTDVVAGGFLLDGFPRTPGQADALVSIVGDQLRLAISLDVSTEVVTRRMLERGRGDDTPESISRRLALYEAETAPLLAWARERDILAVVGGLGSEEDVFSRLRQVIDPLVAARDER